MNGSHLDVDDYYWAQTAVPFQTKIPLEERSEYLRRDLRAQENVMVSGSLVSWGPYWLRAFDYGVFLHLPAAIRMARLRAREVERYGTALLHDPQLKAQSDTFLAWAARYDDPSFDGRSITQHQQWIDRLSYPVLAIEGDLSTKQQIAVVEEAIPLI